jgi:hypothetical protein
MEPPTAKLTSSLQDEEGNYKLPEDEVRTIKQELIGLMISSPSNIQTQLGEAISIIADSDFWTRWESLTKVRNPRYSRYSWKIVLNMGFRISLVDSPRPTQR